MSLRPRRRTGAGIGPIADVRDLLLDAQPARLPLFRRVLVRDVDDASAETRSPRPAVHPADDVIPVFLRAVEGRERRGEVRRDEGFHVEVARSRPSSASARPRRSGRGAASCRRRRRRRACPRAISSTRPPSRRIETLSTWSADRALLPAVLAVHVHRDGAAERDVHRPGHDGRPEPAGDRPFPQVAEREARPGPDDPRGFVEAGDRVQARHLHDGARGVRRGVAVRAARAAEDGLRPVRGAGRERLAKRLERAGPEDRATRRRCRGRSPPRARAEEARSRRAEPLEQETGHVPHREAEERPAPVDVEDLVPLFEAVRDDPRGLLGGRDPESPAFPAVMRVPT